MSLATTTRTAKKADSSIRLTKHFAFWYISLPSLHDYEVKLSNCRFVEHVNTRKIKIKIT